MKRILFVALLLLIHCTVKSQGWTYEEIQQANTAINVTGITTQEKEVIKYLNLARMYPQKFGMVEVKDYLGPAIYGDYLKTSTYKQSLLVELQNRAAIAPVYFDESMYLLALCFAKESGASGLVGHTRISCTKGFDGECCNYGPDQGKDILLQLLIDHNVPSLGHRKICLDEAYDKVGASIKPHLKYVNCCVVDFKRKSNNYVNNSQRQTTPNYSAQNSTNNSNNVANNQPPNFQEAVEYLNNVRANPNAYSNEIGVSLIDVDPMHPLKWNANLAAAAQRKAQDMADRNYFAHVDPDGYGMNYFIQNAGYQLISDFLSENASNNFESLSAGSATPKASIIALIKDEGVVGYGHRKHLLAIDDFWKPCYDIGIGWGYNANSTYKTYCCVLIAKHDWNGNAPKKTEIQQSTPTYTPTYSRPDNNYQTTSTSKSVRRNRTRQAKLISLKIGGSANYLFENVLSLSNTNLSNIYNNQLSYQLNTMFGFNIGRAKKNTTLGLFGNYGKYNPYNTTLFSNQLFSSKHPFIELEAGILIKEFLRLSGGIGYASVNSIDLSSFEYNTITAGFSFGPKWFKLDLSNSILITKDNQIVFYRPSIGLSIVINMIKKK